MIKIEHKDINSIANLHFVACQQYMIKRIDFYIDFFNALGNNVYKVIPQSIQKSYGIEANTAKALVKPFLKKKLKKPLTIGELQTAMQNRNNSKFNLRDKLLYQKCFELFSNVKSDFNNIILSKPQQLSHILSEPRFSLQTQEIVSYCLVFVFNYEKFVSGEFNLANGEIWDNYSFTKSLDISVCPYCNRNWINTVTEKTISNNSKKITSPQLDHFYCKSKYPLARMSFYNLIPSCETCNSRLKGEEKFEYDTHLNPFVGSYGEDCTFQTIPLNLNSVLGIDDKYKIELNTDNCKDNEKLTRVNTNYKFFKIKEIYAEHGDIISELYRKKAITRGTYVEDLKTRLKLTDNEIYRLALGNYYNEIDFKKRPFAKLTKDVAEHIGLVRKKN